MFQKNESIQVVLDETLWRVSFVDFVNLKVSPAGYGRSVYAAACSLLADLKGSYQDPQDAWRHNVAARFVDDLSS